MVYPTDLSVPVQTRFAVLDPIEGDIRSGVHGFSLEDHGDVEVFLMTGVQARGSL